MRIVVGFSGSVATVKCFQLLQQLSALGEVCAVFTEAAWTFFDAAVAYDGEGHKAIAPRLRRMWEEFPDSVPPAPPAADAGSGAEAPIYVYRDACEWNHYRAVGKDPVLHIELRKWADVLLVAPLSANTLAKLSHGLADNLLTSLARAWEVRTAPWLLAPAMNTAMWAHPFTATQLGVLQDTLGATLIPVKASTKLACGDVGSGAMAAVEDIVAAVAGAAAALPPSSDAEAGDAAQ